MNTKEFYAYVEREGLDRAVMRYKDEPEDNESLRSLFQLTCDAYEVLDHISATFCEALRREAIQ